MFEIAWLFKILISLFWLVILPGYFAVSFFKDKNFFNKIGSSFAFGFLFFTFFVELGYLFNLKLNFLLISVSFFNTALLTYYFYYKRRYKLKSKKTISFIEFFVLLILIILGFYIALYSGWYPRGDASVHLQSIRNILSSQTIENPVYSMYNRPVIPDHAYDSYYYLLALLCQISGLKLSIVWHYLTPVLAFFLPFVIYSFVKSLTANRKLIIFSLLAFFTISVFFNALQFGSVYDTLIYPNRIYLWFIFPISLGLFYKYLRLSNFKYFLFSILLAFSMIFVHQSGYLFYLLSLGGFFVIAFLKRNQEYKKALSAIFSLLIISLPIIFIKLQYNKDYIDGASQDIWQLKYQFIMLSESLFMFPLFRHPFFELVILSFFVCVVLFFLKNQLISDNKYLVYAIISSITVPILIVYNPLLVPFLGEKISYVALVRMLRLPMYFLLFAYLIFILFSVINNRFKSSKLFPITIFAILSIITYYVVLKKDLKSKNHEILESASIAQKYIKPNTIVLSDKLSSSDIVSFLDVKTVLIQFNGAVDLIDISGENKDVAKILVPKNDNVEEKKSFEAYIEVLEKYKVDYVFINKIKFSSTVNISQLLSFNKNLNLVFEDDIYLIIERN